MKPEKIWEAIDEADSEGKNPNESSRVATRMAMFLSEHKLTTQHFTILVFDRGNFVDAMDDSTELKVRGFPHLQQFDGEFLPHGQGDDKIIFASRMDVPRGVAEVLADLFYNAGLDIGVEWPIGEEMTTQRRRDPPFIDLRTLSEAWEFYEEAVRAELGPNAQIIGGWDLNPSWSPVFGAILLRIAAPNATNLMLQAFERAISDEGVEAVHDLGGDNVHLHYLVVFSR